MRSIRRVALAFIIALSPVALVGLATSTASARAAHPIVSEYSITVHWTDPVINDTGTMDVESTGSVTFSFGDVGTWELHHKKFTMFVGPATYHGKRTKTGLSGTMSNTSDNSGTWSAVYS
jgi:hypothetical protein